jgi:SAM-dependent methyltransferase
MSYSYIGTELELFSAATNWKSYVAERLSRFVTGRVLEVGAGIGGNIPFLKNPQVVEWTCLEPDCELASRIVARQATGAVPPGCRVATGTIATLDADDRFDTILYLDVLEHINEDRVELVRAAELLSPMGSLVVLAPAHPFLFSPFDAAIGHYRRYNRATLAAPSPTGLRLEVSMMLDSAGFFASLVNRVLLSAPLPSKRQIALWDKFLVPLSRRLDLFCGYKFGKTIVAVWRRGV